MKVLVFDLGGTLMEYVGMSDSWTAYYRQGFEAIKEKYRCGVSEADIETSVEILKKYNPRVNYREEEYAPEVLFSEALAHWKEKPPLKACIDTFWEGLQLQVRIYPETVPFLRRMRAQGCQIAVLTDLPSAMPDERFRRDIQELQEYFDFYVSSQTCGFRKPNTKGLRLIAKHYQVPVAKLIFVGDEEKDRKTALRADCRFRLLNRNERGSGGICSLWELEKLPEKD